jgi:2-methylcitrate dehydratase
VRSAASRPSWAAAGAAGLVEDEEIERFLAAAARLPELAAGELDQLNIKAAGGVIDLAAAPKGLF